MRLKAAHIKLSLRLCIIVVPFLRIHLSIYRKKHIISSSSISSSFHLEEHCTLHPPTQPLGLLACFWIPHSCCLMLTLSLFPSEERKKETIISRSHSHSLSLALFLVCPSLISVNQSKLSYRLSISPPLSLPL